MKNIKLKFLCRKKFSHHVTTTISETASNTLITCLIIQFFHSTTHSAFKIFSNFWIFEGYKKLWLF